MEGKSLDYQYLFKLLLLGDPAVGKSSLLQRFAENQFNYLFIYSINFKSKSKTPAHSLLSATFASIARWFPACSLLELKKDLLYFRQLLDLFFHKVL